jgi:sulfate adenylyltransferase subunit 1
VSALDGDNVVDRSHRTPWYAGPSVLELLEQLPSADDPRDETFRLPVQIVLRPQAAARDPRYFDYRGYAGQIAAGVVRVGDRSSSCLLVDARPWSASTRRTAS